MTNPINGTNDGDYLVDTADDDSIQGLGGNDTISSYEGGSDTILGGAGDDVLGGIGRLDGGDGNDTLYGGSGNGYTAGQHDTLIGGAGDDWLLGNGAGDVISGGDGNDLIGGGGSIDGGAGDDNIFIQGLVTGTVPTVMGGDGNDTIAVYDLVSIIAYGGAGDDRLFGGGKSDTLVGGAGNDTPNGQGGGDHYVLGAAGAANGVDFIPTFYGGGYDGSDQLDFTGADYGFAAGHQLTSAEFTVGSVAVGANAQFVWDQAASTLYWDHDGSGADAAVALATFNPWVQVTADDIHFQ